MSDTVHSMHVNNTYVKSCLDMLRLLYILAQPKVSVNVSINLVTKVGLHLANIATCTNVHVPAKKYKDSSCTQLGHLELVAPCP